MIEAEVTVRQDGISVACYTGTRDELIAAGLATSRMIPRRRGWSKSRKDEAPRWNADRLPDGRWELRVFDMLTADDVRDAQALQHDEYRVRVRRLLDELSDDETEL